MTNASQQISISGTTFLGYINLTNTMKKLLYSLLPLILLSGCDKDKVATGILGEWNLIEVLADPGDGSGRFRAVNSDKRITFLEDGTYTSTGLVCSFSTDTVGMTNGTYTTTETGYQIGCSETLDFSVNLQIEEGFLIVSFPCIEPCLQKFRKLN